MICDDCKEAVEWAKKVMTAAKKQCEGNLYMTETARLSTALPVTYPICQHCNGHHTEQIYETAIVSTDEPVFYLHYKCLDCGKDFYKKKNYIIVN